MTYARDTIYSVPSQFQKLHASLVRNRESAKRAGKDRDAEMLDSAMLAFETKPRGIPPPPISIPIPYPRNVPDAVKLALFEAVTTPSTTTSLASVSYGVGDMISPPAYTSDPKPVPEPVPEPVPAFNYTVIVHAGMSPSSNLYDPVSKFCGKTAPLVGRTRMTWLEPMYISDCTDSSVLGDVVVRAMDDIETVTGISSHVLATSLLDIGDTKMYRNDTCGTLRKMCGDHHTTMSISVWCSYY